MAFIEINFMSEALMRTVTVNVILPADKLMPPGVSKPKLKPFKTLYLLNGIMGNHTDWMNATNIQAILSAGFLWAVTAHFETALNIVIHLEG